MSWENTSGLFKTVPTWMLAIPIVGLALIVALVVVLVSIQIWRGEALVCADGSYFDDECSQTTAIDLTAGAVVAFDRSNGCPTGWEEFSGAAGRFIVGAGRHSQHNQYGNPVPEKKLGETGGQDRVKLEIEHMPKHRHRNPSRGADDRGEEILQSLQATGDGEYGGVHERPTEVTGGDQPHDNMPPYVALLYCKRVQER